jgi:phytoene dehydrogenase-like protein
MIQLGVGNGNPFAVSGTLVVERTLRVGGRLRTIRFAASNFDVGPLAGTSPKLTIARAARGLLAKLRSVPVHVQLHARGPAGRDVTVTKTMSLYAP